MGNLNYERVTVANNVIVGAAFNGIVVSGAKDARMTGNVVIAADDQASWIGVRNVAAASLSDNIASAFNNVNSGITSAGNVKATTISLAELLNVSGSTSAISKSLSVSAAIALPSTMLGKFNLIGFVDSASLTGRTYAFSTVQIDGTSAADRLSAGAVGTYHLRGYDGNDSLAGSKNALPSTVEGGKGDDTYALYQAGDLIIEKPGEGNDTVAAYVDYTLTANVETIRAMNVGLTLHGNSGNNTLAVDARGSILYGEGGDDTVQGGVGSDRLYGNDGNDRLISNGGDDKLDGGTGNDLLYGGGGNDVMLGGDGNDYFEAGDGLDRLTGGKGSDTFVFRSGDFNASNVASTKDVITDFSVAEGDKINLSMIDANLKTAANNAFIFIGSQSFHGTAGELRFVTETDGITLYGDTNGDKIADLGIHLTGVTTITSSSFML